jgi:hypothetical protein
MPGRPYRVRISSKKELRFSTPGGGGRTTSGDLADCLQSDSRKIVNMKGISAGYLQNLLYMFFIIRSSSSKPVDSGAMLVAGIFANN